jgi:hypothetical protein
MRVVTILVGVFLLLVIPYGSGLAGEIERDNHPELIHKWQENHNIPTGWIEYVPPYM